MARGNYLAAAHSCLCTSTNDMILQAWYDAQVVVDEIKDARNAASLKVSFTITMHYRWCQLKPFFSFSEIETRDRKGILGLSEAR